MKIGRFILLFFRSIGYIISFCGLPFVGIIIAGKSKDYSKFKKKIIISLFSFELILLYIALIYSSVQQQDTIQEITQGLGVISAIIAIILLFSFSRLFRAMLATIFKIFFFIFAFILTIARSDRSTEKSKDKNEKNDLKRNFQCSKCAVSVVHTSFPNPGSCRAEGYHHWIDLGEVGPRIYQCEKCGVIINSKEFPNPQGCPSEIHHRWMELS